MSKAVKRRPAAQEHLVSRPIIDFLAYEPEFQAYVAEFVPDENVSHERKATVYLRDGTPTARRVRELLEELARRLAAPVAVVQVAHAGGGDFDFQLADGRSLALREADSPEQSFDLYAVLHLLSQEVQFEFIMQRRSADRAAG